MSLQVRTGISPDSSTSSSGSSGSGKGDEFNAGGVGGEVQVRLKEGDFIAAFPQHAAQDVGYAQKKKETDFVSGIYL